jgi:hypothetical protein
MVAAWPKSTTGDGANDRAVDGDLNTFARQNPALGLDAYTASGRAFGQFPLNALSAEEPAACAPVFWNSPTQTRFDRGCGLV